MLFMLLLKSSGSKVLDLGEDLLIGSINRNSASMKLCGSETKVVKSKSMDNMDYIGSALLYRGPQYEKNSETKNVYLDVLR